MCAKKFTIVGTLMVHIGPKFPRSTGHLNNEAVTATIIQIAKL